MNEKPLCIYHGGCDDGFASAWVMTRAFGRENVELFFGAYQKDPPDVCGREVYIVDFSYKRPVMEEMAERAKRIVVLDHHATAERQLLPLLESSAIDGEFDMDRSGAMMTWNHFFPEDDPPMLIHYIQDRDLWRKEMDCCDEVIMALRSYPQDLDVWSRLMFSPTEELKVEGIAIHRYYRTLVDEAKQRARTATVCGQEVPTVNVPHYLASEVAGELAEDDSFAAAYWVNADGQVTYSLRSRGDVDVGDLAEQFHGGGGHRNAAGFRLPGVASLTNEDAS